MPDRKALVAEMEEHKKTAREVAEAAKADDRSMSKEERDRVNEQLDLARDLKARIDEIDGDAALIAELNSLGAPSSDATAKNDGGQVGRRKSLGERFVEAPEFKQWLENLAPTGQIAESTKGIQSPPLAFRGMKDLITGGSDTSAGALVFADWRGLLDATGALQRPLTLRDVVTVGQTMSDTVTFARVNSFTNASAGVAEATAATGTSGTKPESALGLEQATSIVETIAHWLPATKRALSDAAQIRTLIDNFLRYGLEEELEDQMVSGNGTTPNLRGILNTSGVQTQSWDTNLLVTTRKARTKVRTVGRAMPTAFVFNPEDNERIDLLRDESGGANTGQFMFGAPAGMQVQTLWGLPRVECEAVPAGTGLVGDFRSCVLWDRESASIQVSDSHSDFFTRNMVAILAELRAAFGVIRPSALVEIDLTA